MSDTEFFDFFFGVQNNNNNTSTNTNTSGPASSPLYRYEKFCPQEDACEIPVPKIYGHIAAVLSKFNFLKNLLKY